MNSLLWILQIFFGLYFVGMGVSHFMVPPGLPAMMSWMYELSPALHMFSGTAELLGGLGLILPSVLRIKPNLSVTAAYGLALVMVGAVVFHITRGEYVSIVLNLLLVGLMIFVANGRKNNFPIEAK